MITFDAIIQRAGKLGEKTGWTFVIVPAKIAAQLKPENRQSFRVKGKLDDLKIEMLSLLPIGEGKFMLPLNGKIRKEIKKNIGTKLRLQLTEDKREIKISEELIVCLEDEPVAYNNFKKLPASHQRYYSKWIEDAKTAATKTKRIGKTINAMLNNMSFGEAMKSKD